MNEPPWSRIPPWMEWLLDERGLVEAVVPWLLECVAEVRWFEEKGLTE
jgi:hypothetical protein